MSQAAVQKYLLLRANGIKSRIDLATLEDEYKYGHRWYARKALIEKLDLDIGEANKNPSNFDGEAVDAKKNPMDPPADPSACAQKKPRLTPPEGGLPGNCSSSLLQAASSLLQVD